MAEKEYIEREAAKKDFEKRMQDNDVMCPVIKVLDALEIIDEQPTADVQEVRHGKWIYVDGDLDWADCKCSECGYTDSFEDCTESFYNFCPECGAKMDKEVY